MWYRISMLILLLLSGGASAGIVDTKHNLSITGPGEVKVGGETQICIFCHTRYNPVPSVPAWNSAGGGTTYIPYTSSTLKAYPGQPTGTSLLCLSCHDGTTAMGELVGEEWEVSLQIAMRELSNRSSSLGTDLSDDHPISLHYYDSYSADPLEFVHPGMLTGKVSLDSSGQIQCTSCHDPHDDTLGNFLLQPLEGGELCLTCHTTQGWAGSAHMEITHQFPLQPGAANEFVSRTACTLCHTSHAAGGERLLYFENEENSCLVCHNSEMLDSNLEREFDKPYGHPILETTGVHDPVEPAIITSRHVECVDCHNPHATQTSVSEGGAGEGSGTEGSAQNLLPPSLVAVAGISSGGAAIAVDSGISYEYEVCLRCHGDSNDQPAPPITREDNESNLRLELSPGNPSYHPVMAPGVNVHVPSLLDPYTESSQITCGDCHGNDDATGPVGPHGSIYPALLVREYRTQFPTAESGSSYALCYKCHDRNSILADESFSSHRRHVTGSGSAVADLFTPCSVCHDPHGSQQTGLINFDISVVVPTAEGRREFFTTAPGEGGCYLACHGVDHNPLCYGPPGAIIPGC